jgi:hypothetical protein
MIYSRYARREEESIRRAFRMLGVHDAASAQDLIRRSARGSRLRAFVEASDETGFKAGLADALLHPCVRTFRVDDLMKLVRQTGLEILQFAHYGALEHVDEEVARNRQLEARRESCGNFLLYLGRARKDSSRDDSDSVVVLNPCLKGIVGRLQFGTVHMPPRLGLENPSLGWRERSFLRSFIRPVALRSLDFETLTALNIYKKLLFILQYSP